MTFLQTDIYQWKKVLNKRRTHMKMEMNRKLNSIIQDSFSQTCHKKKTWTKLIPTKKECIASFSYPVAAISLVTTRNRDSSIPKYIFYFTTVEHSLTNIGSLIHQRFPLPNLLQMENLKDTNTWNRERICHKEIEMCTVSCFIRKQSVAIFRRSNLRSRQQENMIFQFED